LADPELRDLLEAHGVGGAVVGDIGSGLHLGRARVLKVQARLAIAADVIELYGAGQGEGTRVRLYAHVDGTAVGARWHGTGWSGKNENEHQRWVSQ